jgi:hypothetical protein
MTAPRTCATCGASSANSKGLCKRCYYAQWKRRRSDIETLLRRVNRTTYLEEVADRNHAWLDMALAERVARKRETSRRNRERLRASLRASRER